MARKKKTPQPIPMPRRDAAPIPAEEPERIEKRGHLDQPLLMLTMLLLGIPIKEVMFLFRGPNRVSP